MSHYLCYTDYTIKSGIRYRYAFQQEKAENLRTTAIYSTYGSVDFEYSYFYRDGV